MEELKNYNSELGEAEVLDAKPCYYTLLPGFRFLLDFHPKSQNIVLVSACSGHGKIFIFTLNINIPLNK